MRIVHRLIALTTICLLGINTVYAISWGKNIDSGLKKAQKEKKCVFLFFTGSDWCNYCITLQKKVLGKSAFKEYAKENLILVKYDMRKKDSQKAQDKIKKIMKKYDAPGFPTIVILDPENNNLGIIGARDDPDKFIAYLKQLVGKKSTVPRSALSAEDNTYLDSLNSDE